MQPLFVFMAWIQKFTALYERKAIFYLPLYSPEFAVNPLLLR